MKRDSVSAYVHMECDTPLPLYPAVRILRTYLIDGLFLDQNIYKDIRMLFSLKYKHLKA